MMHHTSQHLLISVLVIYQRKLIGENINIVSD